MPSKLALASFYTLGLLVCFLAAVILSFAYIFGGLSAWALLIWVVVINFVFWLIGPYVTDLVNKIFYKIKFYKQADFTAFKPELAAFIGKVAQANRVRFPVKIGIIDDDNPTAYTYGSGAFNARIVITSGLFTYLEPPEIEAVFAHELGHIVHRDFIVMTMANTIIQLLYEISQIFFKTRRSSGSRSGNDRGGSGYLFVIGLVAYVFYIIGIYVVLFLSRLREYFADEFSAKQTGDPRLLSRALIKIAYGIMAKEETDKSLKLLESTRTLGIMGFRTAKETGLVAKVTNMEPEKIARVMVFDFVSPWAKLAELGSTHPLTGKRLARLDEISQQMGTPAMFDIPGAIAASQIDKTRLYKNFLLGAVIHLLPGVLMVAAVVAFLSDMAFGAGSVFGILLFLFGASLIIRAFYRFPKLGADNATDVLTLMSDPYATPVRGRPVALSGSVIGRGIPGYMFSEDMMFSDSTGLMYLDYQAGVPIVGNVLFAWKKVKQLLGQQVVASGWFFRSSMQLVTLEELRYQGQVIKSYTLFWNFCLASLAFLAGAVYLMLGNTQAFFETLLPAAFILFVAYIILARKNKIESQRAVSASQQFSGKRVLKGVVLGIIIVAAIVIAIAIISTLAR
ncbi:MAG: M48 family metalloprotease [bacterium]|nr:M48 family metalloprotease [bacterium]